MRAGSYSLYSLRKGVGVGVSCLLFLEHTRIAARTSRGSAFGPREWRTSFSGLISLIVCIHFIDFEAFCLFLAQIVPYLQTFFPSSFPLSTQSLFAVFFVLFHFSFRFFLAWDH